jgi:hypothetical protein
VELNNAVGELKTPLSTNNYILLPCYLGQHNYYQLEEKNE